MRKSVKIIGTVVIGLTIAIGICAWRKPAQIQTVQTAKQTSSAATVKTKTPASVAPEAKSTNRVMVEFRGVRPTIN